MTPRVAGVGSGDTELPLNNSCCTVMRLAVKWSVRGVGAFHQDGHERVGRTGAAVWIAALSEAW